MEFNSKSTVYRYDIQLGSGASASATSVPNSRLTSLDGHFRATSSIKQYGFEIWADPPPQLNGSVGAVANHCDRSNSSSGGPSDPSAFFLKGWLFVYRCVSCMEEIFEFPTLD